MLKINKLNKYYYYSKIMYIINTKKETILLLQNYFQKCTTEEINYYIDTFRYNNLIDFFNDNIYEDDLNLLFIEKYLYIVVKKIINKFKYSLLIKLSIISELIYWDNIFVIKDTIFINKKYLDIIASQIYNIELLQKLCNSILFIILNQYENIWIKYIKNKYNCNFINKLDLNFNIKFVLKPSSEYLDDKIVIYKINNEIYGVFNNIISNSSFSPYYEKEIVKLIFKNGKYEILEKVNNDKYNLELNPFESEIILITKFLLNN